MPFTAKELDNIANSALDFFIRGDAFRQTIQNKPLMKMLMDKQRMFPGGKEFISIPVKGDYISKVQGFEHDDVVSFSNPAEIKRATFPYFNIHSGISLTLDELTRDGISVVDSLNSDSLTTHSERELTAITNLFDDKLDDLAEGWARTFQEMLWEDGTQDPKLVPGIQALIIDDPTSAGSTAGIDRILNDWWRNISILNINTSTPANQNLIATLEQQSVQLRRFGGNPDTLLVGSDFLDAYKRELRANGDYTQTGFLQGGTDGGMREVSFKNLELVYDPTLDDIGRSKFGYMLDSRHVFLKVVEGEDRKTHAPARPAEQYVMFRAITWKGALCVDQLNANAVFSIL